jgi:hypothetical protein
MAINVVLRKGISLMFKIPVISKPALLAIIMLFTINVTNFVAANAFQVAENPHSKKELKTINAPTTVGKPALWTDRGDIASLNLYWGIGGEDQAPKPPFIFEKEDTSGTNPKVKVTDSNGVNWNVKFGLEVNAEVACSRIVWACGYQVEESYFVTSGKIEGVTKAGRAQKFIKPDGSFTSAMFEKRPDTIARRKINWKWNANPFSGSKEFSGLVMLSILLNNWDTKIDNNRVLGEFDEDGGVNEWYIVSDWGGSLGKTGSFLSHTRWDLASYQKQPFIDRISGNSVRFFYRGKMDSKLNTVPLAHIKWFTEIISKLSDEQLRDAFKAAGATEMELIGFSQKIGRKIEELKAISAQ